MCTVSWCRRPGSSAGYHLFFNRDEQRDREAALPPRIDTNGALPFVAARDGRAGGTWLAANARGLTVGILNHYAAARSAGGPERPQSRGALVVSMADCGDLPEFRARMAALEPAARYRPFLLFALDPRVQLSLWCWDGLELVEERPQQADFLTTSSFNSERVCAARCARRAALGPDAGPAALRELHHQHDPSDGAESIRMRRPDARTVSFTEVELEPGELRFRYRPEPPEGLDLLAEVECRLPVIGPPRPGLIPSTDREDTAHGARARNQPPSGGNCG